MTNNLKISLAQWSLHRELLAGTIDNLDFPSVAQTVFGIDAVEYVSRCFPNSDSAYIRQLKTRADDAGVRSLLIMCDRLGELGDPDAARRTAAVDAHRPWIDAAAI